jgi:DNA-binding NarL/FixJ family response regulator
MKSLPQETADAPGRAQRAPRSRAASHMASHMGSPRESRAIRLGSNGASLNRRTTTLTSAKDNAAIAPRKRSEASDWPTDPARNPACGEPMSEDDVRRLAQRLCDLQAKAIDSLQAAAVRALAAIRAAGEGADPELTARVLADAGRRQTELHDRVARALDDAQSAVAGLIERRNAMGTAHSRSESAAASQVAGGEMIQRLGTLTRAQKRALLLLVAGKPNKLIAYEMKVTIATAKAHVSAIYRKLKFASRSKAVATLAAVDVASLLRATPTDDASPAAIADRVPSAVERVSP